MVNILNKLEYVGWPYHEIVIDNEAVLEGDLSLVKKWHFVNADKLVKSINGVSPTNILYLLPNKRPNQIHKKLDFNINLREIEKLAKSKKFIGIVVINFDKLRDGFDDVVYSKEDNKVVNYPKWANAYDKKWYELWYAEFHTHDRLDSKEIYKYFSVTSKLAMLDSNRLYVARGEMIRQVLDALIDKPFAVENYFLFSYMKDFVIHGSTMANKSKLYTASYKDFYKDYANDTSNKHFLTSEMLRGMKLYHISPNPNMTEMSPRVPDSRLSYENAVTKRVCFAPDIPNCIAAIPPKRRSGIMYVYTPIITDDTFGFRPQKVQVSDVGITGEIWICTDVKLKKIGTINLDGDPKEQVNIKPLTESDILYDEALEAESGKLTTAERNALKDKDFGLPKERKYPLNDENHVRQAIKFFNYCPKESRDELAKNIIKACKKFDINLADMEITKRNVFYNYLDQIPGYKKASETYYPFHL